jgi:hypothetical protein
MIEQCMLFAGSRPLPAAAARTNQPENRVIQGKWRKCVSLALDSFGRQGPSGNEPASALSDAGKSATADEAPDRRPGDTQEAPCLVDVHKHGIRILAHRSDCITIVSSDQVCQPAAHGTGKVGSF